MEALMMYVDDWLSSGRVQMMDAAEERGYFRLLLHATKEPDCGLPDDNNQLAILSLLGPQWNRVTKEQIFRVSDPETRLLLTSGQKLRRCFFEKCGRLYNERQLKEHARYMEKSEKTRHAANVRWDRERAERHVESCKRMRHAHADASAMQAPGMVNASKNDGDLDAEAMPELCPGDARAMHLTTVLPLKESQNHYAADAATGAGEDPCPGALFPVEQPKPEHGKSWFDAEHDQWYEKHYWRKAARVKSRAAHERQIRLLVRGGMTHDVASQFLRQRADDDVRRFAGTREWEYREKMHPATWLNGQRWTDQVIKLNEPPPPQRFVV